MKKKEIKELIRLLELYEKKPFNTKSDDYTQTFCKVLALEFIEQIKKEL